MSALVKRPMANVSLEELAKRIAAVVTALTNQECEAQVVRIDFESELNAWMEDTTMLTLRLKLPNWAWSAWDNGNVETADCHESSE